MRKVADPVALDLEVVVDHDAPPVDVDQALAKFLLALVRKQKLSRSPSAPPAAAVGFSLTPEDQERLTP